MKFISTRKKDQASDVIDAILSGLADDGGLYIPEYFPNLYLNEDLKILSALSYPKLAEKILAPFFSDSSLEKDLGTICTEAFHFPIPIHRLKNGPAVLELYHGPTCAFKDVGARFLSAVLSRNPVPQKKQRLVLVATSGDTGGAVAAAFAERKNAKVVILYPKGKISMRQEQQLTCWGPQVLALAVDGVFDDCQRMVKESFAENSLRENFDLISANSISLGRLLPQMTYYAYASLQNWILTKSKSDFIVPTGNLGNAVAGLWAKQLGFPIGRIFFAQNANHAIDSYFRTGVWQPQKTIATLANAMDVGAPSNFERLKDMFPDLKELKSTCGSLSVSDEEIRNSIIETYKKYSYVICPHTATAFYLFEQLKLSNPIVVATASAAKFNDIVAPLLGFEPEVPVALAQLMTLPSKKVEITRTTHELWALLKKWN